MKKTLMMAAAMFAAVSIFAQGTVDFKNIGTAGIIFDTLAGANALAGTTFRVQLYYLPDQANPPTSEQLDRMSLGASATLIAAGFFTGGTRTAPVTPPGAFAFFQVRAWEAAYGATYEEALAAQAIGGRLAKTGKSNIIRIDTADPVLLQTPVALTGLTRIDLSIIPEPSVIGLGLLGAGALLLLRRRK